MRELAVGTSPIRNFIQDQNFKAIVETNKK